MINDAKQNDTVTTFAIIDPTAPIWIPSADWALYRQEFLNANFTCTIDGYYEAC